MKLIYLYILLLIYVLFFLIGEAILFSKAKWEFSMKEIDIQLKNTKKRIFIFLIITVMFPFILVLVDLVLKEKIEIIKYFILFISVSFALALSTQIFTFFGLKKREKEFSNSPN